MPGTRSHLRRHPPLRQQPTQAGASGVIPPTRRPPGQTHACPLARRTRRKPPWCDPNSKPLRPRLLAGAKVYVGNDSGISHLASRSRSGHTNTGTFLIHQTSRVVPARPRLGCPRGAFFRQPVTHTTPLPRQPEGSRSTRCSALCSQSGRDQATTICAPEKPVKRNAGYLSGSVLRWSRRISMATFSPRSIPSIPSVR